MHCDVIRCAICILNDVEYLQKGESLKIKQIPKMDVFYFLLVIFKMPVSDIQNIQDAYFWNVFYFVFPQVVLLAAVSIFKMSIFGMSISNIQDDHFRICFILYFMKLSVFSEILRQYQHLLRKLYIITLISDVHIKIKTIWA